MAIRIGTLGVTIRIGTVGVGVVIRIGTVGIVDGITATLVVGARRIGIVETAPLVNSPKERVSMFVVDIVVYLKIKFKVRFLHGFFSLPLQVGM